MNRNSFIGASEVAALFDCHPYLTRMQLFYRKRGEAEEQKETLVMRLGKHLEPFILSELQAKEFPGAVPSDQKPIFHPTIKGMAATPDAYTANGELIEIKSTSRSPDLPHNYHIITCEHQMMCTQINRNHLVYFDRSRADYDIHTREPLPDLRAEIERRVNQFWMDVAMNIVPDPTAKDYDVLRHVLRNTPLNPDPVEMPLENEIVNTLANYEQARKDRLELEKMEDLTKIKIMAYCQSHGVSNAIVGNYEIKLTVGKATRLTVKER